MLTRLTVLTLIGTALLFPALVSAAEQARTVKTAPRLDHYGDPLPPGAIARLGTLRLRHQGAINNIAFSPDGKMLATSGEYGLRARLWDADTGREIHRFPGTLADSVDVLKFSPSGRILASCSMAGADGHDIVALWDTATGRLLRRLRGRESDLGFLVPGDFAFLDSEKTLVVADSDGKVRWWNATTGKKDREWDAMSVVATPNDPGAWKLDHLYGTTITPDGRILAAAVRWEGKKAQKAQSRLIVWDLERRKQLWHLARERNEFDGFDISVDGKVVAATIGRADVTIRDAVTGKELRRIEGRKDDNDQSNWDAVTLSPDTKMVAASGQGSAGVRVWDVRSGKIVHDLGKWIFSGIRSARRHLVFSPDSKRLAFPWAYTVTLLDVATWSERPRWQGLREPVEFVSFSADGKTLFTGSKGFWPNWASPLIAATWNTATWREKRHSDHPEGFQVVSRDHRLGLVHDRGGDFFVTDIPSGRKLRQLDIRSPSVSSFGGFFSATGKTVVQPIRETGSAELFSSVLAMVDVSSGKKRGSLPNEARETYATFAPDDRTLAWIDKQAVIHVVAVDGGKELRTLGTRLDNWAHLNTAPTMLFSPSHNHLAFWERDVNDVVIWNWRTGKEFRRLPGRQPKIDGTRRVSFSYAVCLAFSPDGRSLAVGSMASEPVIEIWELATGKVRQRISGHLDLIDSLAFSPDGRLLASGSADTTVLVWDRFGLFLGGQSARPATKEQLQALWADLARTDAGAANTAIAAFIRSPRQAVDFLAAHLDKAAPADPKRVAAAIAQLHSRQFSKRREAVRELEAAGDLAGPALRQALAGERSLDTRQLIEELLRRLEYPAPKELRSLRAVEVLEQLATPEATSLLKRLAEGAPHARLTREAKQTLERLALRGATR